MTYTSVEPEPEVPKHLLLTIPQAAAELAVSRYTVYRLIQEKKLRAVHVRASLRVPREEVIRFISSQLSQQRSHRRLSV